MKRLILLIGNVSFFLFSYMQINAKSRPGLEKNNFLIPTAKRQDGSRVLWGALVDEKIDYDHDKELIVPSKLMATVKADFRKYLCEYLQLVLDHVYGTIAKANPHLSDKNMYRYVITMENCYSFFNDKSEMRKIAQRAGIISIEDSLERLLLINRDSAIAIYNERKYFSETFAYDSHFLLINMYHDTCHLSLFKSARISSATIKAVGESGTESPRNVRRMKTVTFDFNFTSRIVFNLYNYVTENICIECDNEDETHSSIQYDDLKKGFLNCIEVCDLSNYM